jgi:hypothetical protein
VLPERLGERPRPGERVRRAGRAGHELDQPHLLHRVEEVQPDDALGSGHARRDRADEQRGRVGGEHRVGRDDVGERGEHGALDVERFRRRLDHDVARCKIGERRRPLGALHSPAGRRVGIVHHDRHAGVTSGRRDACVHRPRSGDPQSHRRVPYAWWRSRCSAG